MSLSNQQPSRTRPSYCARTSNLFVGGVLSIVLSALAFADPPPAPDALTENSAGNWSASAEYATAAVYDDAARHQVGASALRFETDGGFDTRLFAPSTRDAHWNLLAAGGLSFWIYAENNNCCGFQNGSPWIIVGSSETDYIEFHPSYEILNDAIGTWQLYSIPLNGNSTWSATIVGSPNLANVAFLEIHADTWEAGFRLWIDGLSFNVPLAAPGALRAIAGNHQVALSWAPFTDPAGTFSQYRIYRSTSSFTSTIGLTPLASQSGINNTTFTDNTALNGTHYYYAITAVLTGGAETTSVTPVGPRTPRNETDLQIVDIARTPAYPRYAPLYTGYTMTEPGGFGPYNFSAATGLGNGQTGATKHLPALGETVTYTATVRNRGTNSWSGTLPGIWKVDGATVGTPSQSVSLAPNAIAMFTLTRTWDNQLHDINFAITLADARSSNNSLSVDARAVGFLSYVDQSYSENFREETVNYPQAYSDDFIDWLNNCMQRFNQMFIATGSPKRVHFDVLTMLADGAADPAVDTLPYAVFPFRYYATDGSLRGSGYYHPDDDIDYGLLHEMGHQLGLIDIYRMDMSSEQNLVSNQAYSPVPCLMHGCSPFLSENSASAMAHWNNVAHGYFGQYLYSQPAQIKLRILGFNGQPISGATVTTYQKISTPTQGEIIPNQIKFQGTTDSNGEYALPNIAIDPNLTPTTFAGDTLHDNPFGYLDVVGTNGVLHFKVEYAGFVDYAWLDALQTSDAYWAGQTASATFTRQLALGGAVQYYPPTDLTEMNAANWSSWAQDGTLTLSNDTSRKQVGSASLKVVATGGFDNYVRYPLGLLAKWDLSHLQQIHVRCYSVNPNINYQNGSPWIRLGNFQNGFFVWHPAYDILNNAENQWVEFVIPAAGDGTWQRSQFGTPTLADINYFELHADTWGAGFTLWLDGVHFYPSPLPGDLNGDCLVDLGDLAQLLAHYGDQNAAPENGDLDRSGLIDLSDLALLLANYGESCP